MASSTKPTLLLVHGCFGTSAVFDRLAPFLEQAGYETMRADFPSTNPAKPLEVTAQKDVDHVRNEYLLPMIDMEDKDLVLIVHSYGGVVGGSAALGLSKTDRSARNLKGGVVGLVYIAGNIVKENQSLLESAGGQWPPWLIKDKPYEGVAIIDPLIDTLAQDADKTLEPEIRADLTPQGYYCLDTKVSAPCWAEEGYTGRLAYVRTTDDRINPVFAQDMWIEGTGVKWDLVSMNTSHSPMVSQPEQLAKNIFEFVAKFEAL